MSWCVKTAERPLAESLRAYNKIRSSKLSGGRDQLDNTDHLVAKSAKVTKHSKLDRLSLGLATLFGVGRLPYAPGTYGAMFAFPLWWLLSSLDLPWRGLAVFLGASAAVLIADRAGKVLGDSDASSIVIDEVIGCLLALVWFPPSWLVACVAFVMFRVFDIHKPWPIGWLDRRTNSGFLCVLDDLIAGAYAAIVTFLVWFAQTQLTLK